MIATNMFNVYWTVSVVLTASVVLAVKIIVLLVFLNSNLNFMFCFFHFSGTFEDKEITHVEGEVDPVRDLDIINEVNKP